ncbi:esterase/lipase family protein [Acetobacter sp. KSO5]|uniref:esterase/lipase family protein n=1 Tax=Acetobacter sp. KSO5 TaxID=3373674 RepID=UPI00376EB675
MTDVLIFVPGLMGSELWDNKGKVWPGSTLDLLCGYSKDKFNRLLSPDLEPKAILRKAVGIVDVYDIWIRTFGKLINRETGDRMFDEAGAKPTLIPVPYDWRLSLDIGAEALASAIQKATCDHGANINIHIAAHSMGGLVSRFYLQSGQFHERLGFERISSLITFGTPHNGAVVALASALGQERAQFLSEEQSKTLANDARYPAVYHLFPQPGSAPVWERGAGGRLRSHDVYNPAISDVLGLTKSSLASALTAFEQLQKPWPDMRTFFFVGNRFETMTHLLWDGVRAVLVKSKDGGDGTVNLQGSIVSAHQIRLTDKNHMSLIKADEVLMALQDFFDADGLLAMSVQTVISLTPAKLFIEHKEPIEVLLEIDGPAAEVEGILYLERARLSSDADGVDESAFSESQKEFVRSLDYNGPELVSLKVEIEGIAGPAILRPVFETKDAGQKFIGPAFVVKRPD